MHENDLKKIDFNEHLVVCYPGIKPFLIKALEEIRSRLILLPEGALESDVLMVIEFGVKLINDISEDETMTDPIDTDEREGLCAAIYQMGSIFGLDESTDYVDNWRGDW